jgi:hypothetical protein
MKAIYLFLLAILIISSCKKEEINYTPPDGSYGLIYTKILNPSCALSGCHADEDHSNHSHGITLEGSTTYTNLLNQSPKNTQALAKGLRFIAKNDTLNSFVYQKLIWDRSIHKYGAPMPGGGLTLSKSKIEFVKQWIMNGAPESGHVVDQNLINQ